MGLALFEGVGWGCNWAGSNEQQQQVWQQRPRSVLGIEQHLQCGTEPDATSSLLSPIQGPSPCYCFVNGWVPSYHLAAGGANSCVVWSVLYGISFFFFGGREAAPPPEQRYRPQPVRAGVPGLLSLVGSHRLASKPV